MARIPFATASLVLLLACGGGTGGGPTRGNPQNAAPATSAPAAAPAAPAPAEPAAKAPPTPAAPAPEAGKAKPPTAGPGKVVYPASLGKVTFDHASHARRGECGACHDSKPPKKIALTKDTAHRLCKGCHEKQAAGPVKCTACHLK